MSHAFFPPKADLGHLLAVLDKASESPSRRESNCACNITKTGIFIKGSLQKWAKFQSDILAERNDENPKLGDISRIADISRINGHSLSLSLNRSQIIAISVSPAFIVLSLENLFLAKYKQLCFLFPPDQPRRSKLPGENDPLAFPFISMTIDIFGHGCFKTYFWAKHQKP